VLVASVGVRAKGKICARTAQGSMVAFAVVVCLDVLPLPLVVVRVPWIDVQLI
jgi:hypothetical protein